MRHLMAGVSHPFTYDRSGNLVHGSLVHLPVDGHSPPIRCKDIARDLVHHVKYGDRFDLATLMGQWMARRQTLLHDDKRYWPGASDSGLPHRGARCLHSSRMARPPREP
jgi:hypothetical protein